MDTSTTITAWKEKIEADITEMEWGWRALDETEWRNRDLDRHVQIGLAKQEKEAEAGRLHAELAVASFVEEFYTSRRTEVGETLVSQADVESWTDPIFTREEFDRFVQAEAERVALPGVEMRWGPPTSAGDLAAGERWVDLEAVSLHNGQEESRHRYRFHVVGDRVDGWMALAEPSPAEGSKGVEAMALSLVDLAFTVGRLELIVAENRTAGRNGDTEKAEAALERVRESLRWLQVHGREAPTGNVIDRAAAITHDVIEAQLLLRRTESA